MGYSLNSFKERYTRDYIGEYDSKAGTRILDYGSNMGCSTMLPLILDNHMNMVKKMKTIWKMGLYGSTSVWRMDYPGR